MAAHTNPNLIDHPITADIKNAMLMMGLNPKDVSADRPVPPDGHDLMVQMWESGMGLYQIADELRLSEARCSAELLFLAIKGRINRR